MIKATIQNIPYCTEIVFPCTETELSKKLGELGMNPEHLAPIATVIEIEPSELSVLTDCDVSLDALNYLGKRLDGMDKLESKQFLAALSCDEADIGYGLNERFRKRGKICAALTVGKEVNAVSQAAEIAHFSRGNLLQKLFRVRYINQPTRFYVLSIRLRNVEIMLEPAVFKRRDGIFPVLDLSAEFLPSIVIRHHFRIRI